MAVYGVLKGILLTCIAGIATGFVPSAFRLDVADLVLTSNGQSFTHGDMTRGAILAILADVLISNPNQNNENSTRDVMNLKNSGSLSVSSLIDAYYGSSEDLAAIRGQQKVQVQRTIDNINDFNSRTDSDEAERAAAHFDAEQFEDAQERLVEFRDIVAMEISRRNYASARRFMGRLLHTLQDFYSHSNWIEIADARGDSNPSPNLALGERGISIGDTADPTRPTCTNCDRDGTVLVAKLFGLLPFIGSDTLYDCRDNIERTLIADGILTTGYADGGRDSQNRRIRKPTGKCSHGGIIDGTQDSPATGGINKDSTHSELASHYYLHNRAATTAQEHSRLMFSLIREDVNDDELFGEFLGLELDVSRIVSIALVVDNTISQEVNDEIVALVSQITMNIQQYMNTFENDLQVRYILVPVSDTAVGTVLQTVNPNEFSTAVAGLNFQSDGDGSAPILEAILSASAVSEEDSSIFVFTDSSSPSDENLLGQAEAITAQKNLKVTFIHDAPSPNKRSVRYSKQHKRQGVISLVYKELEIFSGGETIIVPRSEISTLAMFISFSAIQSNNMILRRDATQSNDTTHYFFVDSYTFQILIIINGESINVTAVTAPQGTDATVLPQYNAVYRSSTLFIATVNTTGPMLSGRWTVRLTSQASYTIQVLGEGELTFLSNVVTIRPNATDDINDLKPLAGLNMSAELTFVGSVTPVNITALNIIDETRVIQSVNVNRMSDSFIGMFTPPQEEFKMQVIGVDDNGYNFSYISDISIEPTSISLTFGENDNGYLTLSPGMDSAVTIVLLNAGASQRFRIAVIVDASVDNSGVQYSVNNSNPLVLGNSQVDIVVSVSFPTDVPLGLSVTFTVVAQSVDNSDINDFITFDAVNVREVVSGSPYGIMYTPVSKMNLLITLVLLLLLLHN